MKLSIIELSTFVATCRTVKGALELARFMECKSSDVARTLLDNQIYKFNVVVDSEGKIEVHSVIAVNDLGLEDFKQHVTEFLEMKGISIPAKKPIARVTTVPASKTVAA